MENASKALIMAGSVLVALIIIGALALMFNSLHNYQNSNTRDVKDSQILEFNNQYTGFVRNNVRGSDVYSLLNKVVDYNRRQSTAGTGTNNGQYLAYEPMTVTVTIRDEDLDEFHMLDQTEYLIGSSSGDVTFTASNIENSFDTDLQSEIHRLESTYGKEALGKLVEVMTKIFLDDSAENKQKDEAVDIWNKISAKKQATDYNNLKKDSIYRKDVYKYREYIQFKRAKFDCKKADYNENTGRIVSMIFESTGKFE